LTLVSGKKSIIAGFSQIIQAEFG